MIYILRVMVIAIVELLFDIVYFILGIIFWEPKQVETPIVEVIQSPKVLDKQPKVSKPRAAPKAKAKPKPAKAGPTTEVIRLDHSIPSESGWTTPVYNIKRIPRSKLQELSLEGWTRKGISLIVGVVLSFGSQARTVPDDYFDSSLAPRVICHEVCHQQGDKGDKAVRDGRCAITWVLRNRVEWFLRPIDELIKQKNQFTGWEKFPPACNACKMAWAHPCERPFDRTVLFYISQYDAKSGWMERNTRFVKQVQGTHYVQLCDN